MVRGRLVMLGLGVGAAVALSACGAPATDAPSTPVSGSSTSGATSPTAASPAPSASGQASVTSSPATSTTTGPTAPAGAPKAFPGAGGPRPATAVPLPASAITVPRQSYERKLGAVQSPSGVTTCDLVPGSEETNCRVAWTTPPCVDEHTGECDTLSFGKGVVPKPGKNSGTQAWQNYPITIYPVPYGTQVWYGDWVAASEKTGLTVWNVKTGHGAWMAREGFQAF